MDDAPESRDEPGLWGSGQAPPPIGGGAVQVIPAFYDFIVWLAPKLAQYPKVHRFTLGDRTMTVLLEVLVGLIVATSAGVVALASTSATRSPTFGSDRAQAAVNAPRTAVPSRHPPLGPPCATVRRWGPPPASR